MTSTIRSFAFWLLLLGIAGCGNDVAPDASDVPRLRILLGQYNQATTSKGRPPANQKELKDFMAGQGKTMLDQLKVANPDELFTSERDGKPYVVIYGRPPAGVDAGVVAYEQDGVDGKRQVAYKLGLVEELDEARFRELVPASAAVK